MIKKNKSGDFNFVWLFAIIAGAIILLLAIYGASKIIETKRYQTDTETAKELTVFLNPLQAGFAEGEYGRVLFNQETRINNFCDDSGFGENKISTSTKSSIGNQWSIPGAEISVKDKYVFSTSKETKELKVFSTQFEFPYKIADLLMFISENYCFTNLPEQIENDVPDFVPGVYKDTVGCPENAKTVCFGSGGGCDITVIGTCSANCKTQFDEGYVLKDEKRIYYVNNLLYAAIFSEKDIYDCNVKRLMYRAGRLAEIYIEKANLMSVRGCNTNLVPDLNSFKAMLENAGSEDLVEINQIAKELDSVNKREVCGLW